jgi:hypothetical protein
VHLAQPGRWLGPVTGPGRAGWVQPSPCGLSWIQPKKKLKKLKIKKTEKIKMCMHE